MYRDEYRNEMNKIEVSESLIADTLEKMRAEQEQLQAELTGQGQAQPQEQQVSMHDQVQFQEQVQHQGQPVSEVQTLPADLHPPQNQFQQSVQPVPQKQTPFQGQPVQAQYPPPIQGEFNSANNTQTNTATTRARKRRRSRILWIGLPAAACLVLALVGVSVVPQLISVPSQSSEPGYEFQLVEANTSLSSGLQFGSIDGQGAGVESNLKQAECIESLLPEGILSASPVMFGEHSVYLGYDEEQATYYAAYQKDAKSDVWTVLQSTSLDEDGFVAALEDYLG